MQLRPLVFLAASALAFAPACKASRSASRAPKELAFSLPDLSGKTVDTTAYRGRVILVDFWATWCKPCEHSFPFYSGLQKELGAQGFTILAISVDERDEDVQAFLVKHPVSFQVLRDPDGKVARSIDRAIDTMPTAVLIGRDGRVRLVHAGFVSGDEVEMTRAVKAALAEPVPDPAGASEGSEGSEASEEEAPGDAPREAPVETSTVSAP